MSGHSKWSKIKHQKESTDTAKGKVFTRLGNAITIAVREGQGNADPQSNFKLRLAIEKARSHNMPKVNIVRAIEKALGTGEQNNFEEIVYEALGPFGVGFIILAGTDNKQRTVAAIKNILQQHQAVLASGAIMPLFEYVGRIIIPKSAVDSDKLMEDALELGAVDLTESSSQSYVITPKDLIHKIKEGLEERQIDISGYELYYRPKVKITIPDVSRRESIGQLVSKLEELDDVQKVYTNLD